MKLWTIAWKDTRVRFRDRNGLLLMLAVPLVLSAIVGAALGGLGSSRSPVAHVPVLVVVDDPGELGRVLAGALVAQSEVLDVAAVDDLPAAIRRLEAGEARAVVHVPADFSARLAARARSRQAPPAAVELLTDPASVVAVPIVDAVVRQIVAGVDGASRSREVALERLDAHAGLLGPALARARAVIEDEMLRALSEPAPPIALSSLSIGTGRSRFEEVLGTFAPSLAVFFLMLALFEAARSILEEERTGTLARLRATPTGLRTILAGKAAGVVLTGLIQFAVLVLASRAFFGLRWGSSPAGLVLMVVAVVAASSALGLGLAAVARDVDQAGVLGGATVMVLAIVGGNLVPPSQMPPALRALSLATPNRWALDGFTDLTLRHQGWRDVLPEAAVLLTLALVLFALAGRALERRLAG